MKRNIKLAVIISAVVIVSVGAVLVLLHNLNETFRLEREEMARLNEIFNERLDYLKARDYTLVKSSWGYGIFGEADHVEYTDFQAWYKQLKDFNDGQPMDIFKVENIKYDQDKRCLWFDAKGLYYLFKD